MTLLWRSSDAQKLKRVLTTYDKTLSSEDPLRIYLLWEPCPNKPSPLPLLRRDFTKW